MSTKWTPILIFTSWLELSNCADDVIYFIDSTTELRAALNSQSPANLQKILDIAYAHKVLGAPDPHFFRSSLIRRVKEIFN